MKRVNNKKNLYKSIILLAIVVIGIGYAYLTSNLSITGATEVVANTWDIHFENLNVTTGSVIASNPAIINSDNTTINYSVTLSRPKDFYEFTVDVVNEGTLPGKVSISELSGLDTTSSKIIDYTIKYTNDSPVNVGDILNGGATKTIKVRVYYKDDIDEDDFPDNNLNLNLTYTLQYVQSEEDAPTANDIIQQLKNDNASCFTKYTGEVTDQVGQTVEASNVYFNKCADKRNIKFAGYCWQMIRTTETGGIKMIYNGEPDSNGECTSSRSSHKGIIGASGSSETLDASYLYGDSFTYDIANNSFKLTNTETAIWSDSTYENLIGKYTCKNTIGTCTTLYNVNGYSSNTSAYTSSYTVGNTSYSIIGTSAYNANYRSPATVGYMFNKVYNINSKSVNSTKYGSYFTYENGNYTLSGTIKTGAPNSTSLSYTHYTCWNDTGTCNTISYIYRTSSSTWVNYIDITDGKDINDILEEMLSNNNVNRYNSSIKGIIDAWYAQNLSNQTHILEDTVYCNARNIINYGGWNPDGGRTDLSFDYLQFKSYNKTTNLNCPNETDQFSVGNNKAKLTYPIALLQDEERFNINNDSLITTGPQLWELSPNNLDDDYANMSFVYINGGFLRYGLSYSSAVRPVVTLKSVAQISSGTGSESDPWVID